METVQRRLVLIMGIVITLAGCSWPFGGTIKTVAFTVLDTSNSGFEAMIPQAKIVNIGEQAIDILITGEALNNGAYPLLVNKVKADSNEIRIILDWEKGEKAFSQSVHKLIRLEKGDWWQSKKQPRIKLFNMNGGRLDAEAKTREVRQAILERLPELTDEKIYLKFSLQDMTASATKGVWEGTVVGTLKDGGDAFDIVATCRVDDHQLTVLGGQLTYYSTNNGTIVKVEQLD